MKYTRALYMLTQIKAWNRQLQEFYETLNDTYLELPLHKMLEISDSDDLQLVRIHKYEEIIDCFVIEFNNYTYYLTPEELLSAYEN